jgi:hypothetical protein
MPPPELPRVAPPVFERPHNGTSPSAVEPTPRPVDALVTRWDRILGGRIEPTDYLTLPPDAMAWVEHELAFAEARLKGIPLDPDYRRDILQDRALDYHYGGKMVATLHRPDGVIVLAVGIDEIALLYRTVTGERRAGIGTEHPRPW